MESTGVFPVGEGPGDEGECTVSEHVKLILDRDALIIFRNVHTDEPGRTHAHPTSRHPSDKQDWKPCTTLTEKSKGEMTASVQENKSEHPRG